MANPLLLFLTRHARRGVRPRQAVPASVPSTDAIFLILRKMRAPLVMLIAIFAVSVFGLSLIEGNGTDGQPGRVSVFDSFYFISYTATTIGFGEIAPFTTAQRMWVTFSIYLTVVGWAYTIGSSISLLQDQTFREAVATQRFQRRVRRLGTPFTLVAGYGRAGRVVARELDSQGLRVVVLDNNRVQIERLSTDQLHLDVPGLEADATLPGVLGLAGLGDPHCAAVLALTDSDDVNLAVVMTATLLRPDVPVIARCHDRRVIGRMHDFGASAVINPGDRFGNYLVLAMTKPVTFRLITWLMAGEGATIPVMPVTSADGPWVVAATGTFAADVAADLGGADLPVVVTDPLSGDPDLAGAAGFVAGSDSDTLNLALAEHARLAHHDLFVAVRQDRDTHQSLAEAIGVDSVYRPTDLVASEALARVITPLFWGFVEHAVTRGDDAWAQDILDRLTEQCGELGPSRFHVRLDDRNAPAVARWLRTRRLTLGELVLEPDHRVASLHAVPLLLHRDGATTYAPGPDTELRVDDQILMVGRHLDLALLRQVLDYDSVVHYLATGQRVPDAWILRQFGRRRSLATTTPRP